METSKRFFLLDEEGLEHQLSPEAIQRYSDTTGGLEKLAKGLERGADSPTLPDHMRYVRERGWADLEPASDAGHIRFAPKGALIYQLLADWIQDAATGLYGSHPVVTPSIFQWQRPDIQGQAGIFSDSVYFVAAPGEDPEFVLRFNGDVGLFRLLADVPLSYRHLPLRVHELAVCFRYMQSGALSGIRHARSWNMCDMHSFCASPAQALNEYTKLHQINRLLATSEGFDLTTLFRVGADAFEGQKEFIMSIVRAEGKPVILEILPQLRQYWSIKSIQHTNHPHRVFHVQLDDENGSRYGVLHTTEDQSQRPCVIVHNSLASIERWMLIMLERALGENPPQLPLWLAPNQVRIVPVATDRHLEACTVLGNILRAARIRAVVDDRDATVGKRIKLAENDWVPYSIVFGDRDSIDGPLTIRVRGTREQQHMTARELEARINEACGTKPFRQIPNALLSNQPNW